MLNLLRKWPRGAEFISHVTNKFGLTRRWTKLVGLAPVFALIFCLAPLFFRESPSSAVAQTLQERHAQLRAALDRNDQAGAESLLRGMMASEPDAFARNNYDYLLARLLENRQAADEARTF